MTSRRGVADSCRVGAAFGSVTIAKSIWRLNMIDPRDHTRAACRRRETGGAIAGRSSARRAARRHRSRPSSEETWIEPGQENVRQLDEQAVISDIETVARNTCGSRAPQLRLEELQLLHFHRIDLRFGGDAFRVWRCARRCASSSARARASPRAVALGERAMDDEIGVTPDRAGEMGVVVFREAVMTERLGGVARALEALQQADLERLLLRLAARRGEQPLQLARGCVRSPDLVTVAQDELAIFRQLVRIGIFVDAVDRRDAAGSSVRRATASFAASMNSSIN